MNIKLLSVVLALLIALPLMAAPRLDQSRDAATTSMQTDNETFIDANNILMFVTNHGNFGRDLSDYFGNDYGTYWPFSSVDEIFSGANVRSPLYAGGLWIGATDQATGDTLVIISEYSDEYVPGPMSGGTFMTDRPEFRVYKLYSDSLKDNPNQDYDEYLQYAVGQGAPFLVDSLGDTIPEMLGDQMLWSVFNDADPAQHSNDAGETAPLGVEVQTTAFAYDRENPLGDIVFLRFRVFNKGSKTLENCYFSIWDDPDLGGAGDDLVGCDTSLSLGYTYNANNNDQYYGSTPPAYGVDFFQGPMVYSPGDSAKMWGQYWQDSVNLAMSSFNKYINGTDPNDYIETYNYMNGLNADGSDYTYNGQPTTFVHTGDPITGIGDLDVAPADRRFMMSTGPITFAPGDSTEILCALIVGQGGDRLSSIAVLKYYDEFAQTAYDIDFDVPEAPAAPVVTYATYDREFSLSWTDISEQDPGDYPFQGYSVYQGESPTGPWTLAANYDIIDGVGQIQDRVLDPLTGSLEIRLVKNGSDAGIQRYFLFDRDYITGGNLNNVTAYYFKVEAYSYDPAATPVTLTSSSGPLTIRPQAPPAGYHTDVFGYDTLDVTHTSAGPVLSDGSVIPIVLDPLALTGDTYRVIFRQLLDGSYVWDLENATADSTIFSDETNQSGDGDYFEADGFVVKVLGPPVALKGYGYDAAVANDARPFTGVNWGGSGFFGGIGVLDEFFVSDLTAANVRAVEIRFVDPGTGQNAYLYDRSNGYAFEGYVPQDFEVWDVTPGSPERQINFAFVENNFALPHTQRDSVWNPWVNFDSVGYYDDLGGREYFQIIASDYTATANPVYAVNGWFNGSGGTVWDVLYGGWLHQRGSSSQLDSIPNPGDVFSLEPNYINLPVDTFTFIATSTSFTTTESDLNAIKAVPNPFYLYGPYDPSPGNKNIYWHHLPQQCTITIYNLSGELMRTLEKNDASALAYWDLLTEKGLPVASGIYIWVVDAPGFGQKVGKMAIFMEQEVLQIY
ncbi:hypothetical protein KQH82_08640 [bacterium]|nr:hypothetical protein [bacterium]